MQVVYMAFLKESVMEAHLECLLKSLEEDYDPGLIVS
jgi:hypothetical protein